MRKRNNMIVLRLSDDELKYLNDSVKRSFLNRETYLRELIKGHKLIERPSVDFYSVLSVLHEIQLNLLSLSTPSRSNEVDRAAYWKEVEYLNSVTCELLRVVYHEYGDKMLGE